MHDITNYLFVLSILYRSDSGIAIVSAASAREAFTVLKRQGVYNGNPNDYILVQSKNIGMYKQERVTLVYESYTNALVAYDAIVSVMEDLHLESPIEHIKVNGTELEINDKTVNITVPTALADLSSDVSHRTVTDIEKSIWNNKADASAIPDVSGKADRVQSAVAGHIATLDSSGNLVDSGKGISDINPLWGNIQGFIENQTDLMGALGAKQDVINDLDDIRAGAAAGGMVFIAEWNVTPYADVLAAVNGGKIVFCQIQDLICPYLETDSDGTIHFGLIVEKQDAYAGVSEYVSYIIRARNPATSTGTGWAFARAIRTPFLNTTSESALTPNASESLLDIVSLHKISKTGNYNDLIKPVGGIPKTDLAQGVQDSLALADSALQSFTESDPTVPSWAKAENKPTYNYSEIQSTPDLSQFITKSVNDLTYYYTKTEVDGKVSSAYKAAGTVASVASLGTLDAAHEGFVYNMSSPFTTTSDFVEGSGTTYPTGTNVAIVNTGTTSSPVYKYDVLAGFVDISGKADKSEMSVVDGTDANADKTTITLKSGTSATVLKSHQDISGKADKVSGATSGHLAALDGNGNLTDSGKSASDLTVEANPTVPSGTTPTSLTGLKIGSGYYSISGGGGSVSALSNNDIDSIWNTAMA